MPKFSGISAMAADGCLVKPLLISFLQSNDAFRVKIDLQRSQDRDPDGWFHASTHPTMTDRELFQYLTVPPVPQPLLDVDSYVFRMSTMFGTICHEVVRQALIHLKIVVPVRSGFCLACGLPQPRMCREHGAIDPETRSRGHLDAILRFGDDIYGFDFKTIYPMGLAKVPDMDLEFFIGKWPKHYAQALEYMRLTGLRKFIFLYMTMGNPWEFREFHIPFDPVASMLIEQKYKRVLGAIARGEVIIA